MSPSSTGSLVEHLSLSAASGPALFGDGGFVITHAQLQAEVSTLATALRQLGIARTDRVAFVLPSGPALATTFLAVSAVATAAPLNPAYTEADFTFYLGDLQAAALILPADAPSLARVAALAAGVPVFELVSPPEHRGVGLSLRGPALPNRAPIGSPPSETLAGEPGDIALVLHTSGTTSRPKQVPLSHANLLASARHIGATLALGPTDRCLNVMPLFHIHGLVAGLLAALHAGGSAVCTPAFRADHLPAWLARWQPTWLTAVPTMHQAVLAHYAAVPELAAAPRPVKSSLRFIRSSSAALPPTVLSGLETLFGVPVAESYGMTEAAHQMASNPLPPRERKPGSVGPAAGPEIAILDASGRPLTAGQTGEIAIRGPNVTAGYVNNPEANATAFTAEGWFRTGDQGHLDADGYLTLTGRLKELINRGGEKIAPREIDEALLTHPDIRQALAFAVPHPTLGENIAAAVVLAPGSALDEDAVLDHALARLPFFKVPARIVVLADLPKGPTGKVQRIGLATRLAAELAPRAIPPIGPVETKICALFAEVLALASVGRHDNFFALGGDSLRATRVLTRLRADFSADLPADLVFKKSTPARLAARLAELTGSQPPADAELDALTRALAGLSPAERAALLADSPRETS